MSLDISIRNVHGSIDARLLPQKVIELTTIPPFGDGAAFFLTAEEAKRLAEALNQMASRIDPPNPMYAKNC